MKAGVDSHAERGLHAHRVDVEAHRVDVREHGGGPEEGDGLSGGREREGGHHDGIAGTDAVGEQGQHQGIGAAGAAHRVGGSREVTQLRLEACDFGAHDELAVVEHRGDGRVDLGGDAAPLFGEVDECERARHRAVSSVVGWVISSSRSSTSR